MTVTQQRRGRRIMMTPGELDEMPHDGRHAWVRLTPEKIVSWDFRKLGG